MDIPATLKVVLDALALEWEPFLVGGCVRDSLMGIKPHDYDVMVYGPSSVAELAVKLREFGTVDLTGASFLVARLRIGSEEYEFSLPRTESLTGTKHTDFAVQPATPAEDAPRRDFTINAMRFDWKWQQLIDEVEGQVDLRMHVLRHVSPAFADDPLRVLRAARFRAKLGFTIDATTEILASKLAPRAKDLPKERVLDEMSRVLYGERPSRGLWFLVATGWMKEILPEVDALWNVRQDPVHHPEGNALVHTFMVVDAMREHYSVNPSMLWAALLHDIGKATTTTIWPGGSKITSYGHETESARMVGEIASRLGFPTAMAARVTKLCLWHMFSAGGKDFGKPAVRRLSHALSSENPEATVTIYELCQLMHADSKGRSIHRLARSERADKLLQISEEIDLTWDAPQPLVHGRDLLPFMAPGPEMGQMLTRLFDAQLNGEFSTTEEGVDLARFILGLDINE